MLVLLALVNRYGLMPALGAGQAEARHGLLASILAEAGLALISTSSAASVLVATSRPPADPAEAMIARSARILKAIVIGFPLEKSCQVDASDPYSWHCQPMSSGNTAKLTGEVQQARGIAVIHFSQDRVR